MVSDLTATHPHPHDSGLDHEVVVVGAGVCGIYQMVRLKELNVDFITLEAHPGLGGTWFQNRYPGCRFDSESYSYGYSFSQDVLKEWDWTERFASQPETLRYLNYVAEKFDLISHIQFNSRVSSAQFREDSRSWLLTLDDGRQITTRFLLTAIGLLSTPTTPTFESMDSFEGLSFHTYNWPSEPIDLTGKRVAVIGTGASGVQVISEIADKVDQLTVFQRRPNWCAPLHNSTLSATEMDNIRERYDEIFDQCRQSPSGFLHMPDSRKTFEVSEAERLEFWEMLYNSPGFGIWLGNFRDTLMDETANAELSQFIAAKIRQRVKDPVIADKLIPKDHGFGTRRVPLETRYYEAYNRDNVELIDLFDTPIETITPQGLRTSEREFEFDIIVYATGFDAITGAFERIDIVGANGRKLKDRWKEGPVTSLGVQVHGFPNLITLVGPQGGSVSTNFPRGIEEVVNWTTTLLEYMWSNGYTRIEATEESEEWWGDHVREMADKMLLSKTKSWFTGYNTNINRDDKPRYLIYTGGSDRYRKFLAEQIDQGWPNFQMQ